MECAGLLWDESSHYLDHIAPFCALHHIPLLVGESAIASLAQRYYPDVTVVEGRIEHCTLPRKVVCCSPRQLVQEVFPEYQPDQFFWLPHGSSDKGWKVSIFDALHKETALVYGQKMVDVLHAKQIDIPTIRIGNFRAQYWNKHRLFYDAILQKEVPIPAQDKLYIYAPTWDDMEGNGSFWRVSENLFSIFPSSCGLLVKIHPNMYQKDAPRIEHMIGKYRAHKNIVFVVEFMPIYPLLDLCDAYIGDMSSIGYDFLYWNRPMFFLNSKQWECARDPGAFLYRCGTVLNPNALHSSLFQYRDNGHIFQNSQKQVYEYTFDSDPQYGI